MRPLLLLLLLTLCSSCGYRLVGTPAAMGGSRTVSVEMFENRTHRAAAEAVVTSAIIDELSSRRNSLRVTPQGAYRLTGAVRSFSSTPAAFSRDDRITEYRAEVVADAVLSEAATGKIVWRRTITARSLFPAHDVPLMQRGVEDEAVSRAARELARQLFAALTEDF